MTFSNISFNLTLTASATFTQSLHWTLDLAVDVGDGAAGGGTGAGIANVSRGYVGPK